MKNKSYLLGLSAIVILFFAITLLVTFFYKRTKTTTDNSRGTYTPQTNPVAILPTTQPRRIFAYMPLNHWDSATMINEQVDEMANLGATLIAINIKLDDIFSSYAELQANSNAKWSKIDQIVDNIKAKNLPVFIRFVACVSEQYYNISDWWGVANNIQDEWGESIMANHINTHPSLNYQAGVGMLLEFVQKGTNRYYNSLGSLLYAVGVSTTSDYEAGYNYRNEVANGLDVNNYNVMCDYSPHSINAYKASLLIKYGNITSLNNAWGTSYPDFASIQPPKLGTPMNQKTNTTLAQLRNMLNGKRGEDWYMFNHITIRNFVTQVKNIIKSHSSNIIYVGEYGSVFDDLSFLRISHNLPDICRNVDVIKTDFATRNASNTLDSLSADFVRSIATKPIWSEIADFDSFNYQATIGYINSAFMNGARYMAIISSKYDINKWNFSKQAMSDMVTNWENAETSTISTQGSINVTLSECIHDFPSVKQRWANAGGSPTKNIFVNFNEDLQ